ncbi:MAG: LptF/LptG family permease [bacterium]
MFSSLRKVDKLILSELYAPFFFGVGMFSMLTIVVVVLQESLKFIIKYNVPSGVLLKMLIYAAPQFVILSIPMGVLLGVLISMGKLNSELQVTALRACGVSLYRVLAPYFIAGAFLSGLTFLGNETVVPWGLESLRNLKNSLLSGGASGVKMGAINQPKYEDGVLRWLLVADDSEGSKLYNVILLQRDPDDHTRDQLIIADEAEWEGSTWIFRRLQTYYLSNPDTGEAGMVTGSMAEMRIGNLDISPESLRMRKQDVENLRIVQLMRLLNEEKAAGADPKGKQVLDIRTKLYSKYAIPFTPLVFIIIAVPLSILPQRSSTSMGMGLALLIVMVYYVLLSVCQKMGASGVLPPLLGAWLPNLLICSVGLVLMQRRERN